MQDAAFPLYEVGAALLSDSGPACSRPDPKKPPISLFPSSFPSFSFPLHLSPSVANKMLKPRHSRTVAQRAAFHVAC